MDKGYTKKTNLCTILFPISPWSSQGAARKPAKGRPTRRKPKIEHMIVEKKLGFGRPGVGLRLEVALFVGRGCWRTSTRTNDEIDRRTQCESISPKREQARYRETGIEDFVPAIRGGGGAGSGRRSRKGWSDFAMAGPGTCLALNK